MFDYKAEIKIGHSPFPMEEGKGAHVRCTFSRS